MDRGSGSRLAFRRRVASVAMAEQNGKGPAAALFDVDGTLVDTNYPHAVTWWEAALGSADWQWKALGSPWT
jgi:hypothetical protein